MSQSVPAWRRTRERGNRSLLLFMRWMGMHAPDWITAPLIWGIALYFTLLPGQTVAQGATRYFQTVYGRPATFADRYRQVCAFAFVVLERVKLLADQTDGFTIDASGERIIDEHHLSRKGGVLLGAHFGSFEAMRAFDRQLPGLKVRYLMFQDNAEASSAVLNAINPDVAAAVIDVRDGPSAMLAVRSALEDGQFVAFLGDRMPTHMARGEITVDFLGAPIKVPRAPYYCAILAQRPLILCFAPRKGLRSYDITFTEIYDGAAVPRCDRDRICRELAQVYADALSDMCRRHPYNWFNFFDIWRRGE
ncbi:MAG: hypothetical protein AAFV19_06380 [Pseudomonadota bacterium]